MWAVAGLLLIIADVVFGTFFMLFLGMGAILTALAVAIGLPNDLIAAQWLIFAVTSALGLILFRKKLVRSFGKESGSRYEEHVGQHVEVTTDIPHNGQGRVKYRGAEWPAITEDGSALSAGHKATITSTDGIILQVRKN